MGLSGSWDWVYNRGLGPVGELGLSGIWLSGSFVTGEKVIGDMGANPGGATGAIAPPRICHEGLNIALAPPENDEIASLLLNSPPTSKSDLHP